MPEYNVQWGGGGGGGRFLYFINWEEGRRRRLFEGGLRITFVFILSKHKSIVSVCDRSQIPFPCKVVLALFASYSLFFFSRGGLEGANYISSFNGGC